MDKVKATYLFALLKSSWKEILVCLALLLVILVQYAGQIVSSGSSTGQCIVTAKSSIFELDGNEPFVVCALPNGREVNVFTSKAGSLKVGDSIAVAIVERPLWFSNRYLYEGSAIHK